SKWLTERPAAASPLGAGLPMAKAGPWNRAHRATSQRAGARSAVGAVGAAARAEGEGAG
ncbi:hypothetical protein IscW_ISCW014644, partial [Ixodes scapularis]